MTPDEPGVASDLSLGRSASSREKYNRPRHQAASPQPPDTGSLSTVLCLDSGIASIEDPSLARSPSSEAVPQLKCNGRLQRSPRVEEEADLQQPPVSRLTEEAEEEQGAGIA